MWTNDDFRIIFAFLRDIRASLDDETILRDCRDLLKRECEDASRRLARIADSIQD